MVEQKEWVAHDATRSCGVEIRGQKRRPSRVSTTDSEMSENSGSVCSVFEERVSRNTLLRVLATREETSKDLIDGQERILDSDRRRGECRDNVGTRNEALKKSKGLCADDDLAKDEMNKFTWHNNVRRSERFCLGEMRDTSGSMDSLEEKRQIYSPNGEGSGTGYCVPEEHKKNVSRDLQRGADSSSTAGNSTKQRAHHKEDNKDSYEGKVSSLGHKSSYDKSFRGYRRNFQPIVGDAQGMGRLNETTHHEREHGKEIGKDAMDIYNSGARRNSLSSYRKAVRMGEGKDRRSWDFANSRELVRRWESRKRNYPQETFSSVGNDSSEFLSDAVTFSDHGQASPRSSKVSTEGSRFASEVIRETSQLLSQELQSSSRRGPTKSSRPNCVRKRSRETWPTTMEGMREIVSFTAEVPTGIISSAGKELRGNTSFIPSVALALAAAKFCQPERLPSTRQVRKETSLSTAGEPKIALSISKEEETEEEEKEVRSDGLSFLFIKEECGKNICGGLTVNRNESLINQYFARDGLRRSFDLSDSTALLCTSTLHVAGSTRSLCWQRAKEDSRWLDDTSDSEMFKFECCGELTMPIVHNELNTQTTEVREVPSLCPDSGTRVGPITRCESGNIEESTGPDTPCTNDVLGTPKNQSTFRTRHFQQAPDGTSSPPELRTYDSSESRPLTLDSLTGERIRPRDYSSHHNRAPAVQHSISVPARLEPPRARSLLTARQRDALLEVRMDGHQVIRTQVVPGREKRDKVFTKRERKATTTLAIVLGKLFEGRSTHHCIVGCLYAYIYRSRKR